MSFLLGLYAGGYIQFMLHWMGSDLEKKNLPLWVVFFIGLTWPVTMPWSIIAKLRGSL